MPNVDKTINDAVENTISDAKEKLPNVTPNPPGLKSQSSAHDLKARLEWGEPALTIVDVRDHQSFNEARITGAINMPADTLPEQAKSSLESNRDVYVYGGSDEETSQAAAALRSAGFNQVAELKGGLNSWKEVAGSTEGSAEAQAQPPSSAYNVASQVAHHQETQSKNV